MATTYPTELVFELPDDDARKSAIERAAAVLGLAVSADASTVRVTVQSPSECYLLGRATHPLLEGAPPPLPLPTKGG